ncbi:phage-shock protein [Paenibacillus swuensis]|uniref:Phage-shock protein n=1 Tax=Paenibacillus swuensis TaxID=1178515 RepID=A0A172TDT1_9BACL|nr:PspA/IM30 family protein [Paenibacillus swuensis]ANE45112.1 phage-shock protein [Paenibacillus swuensis]
MSVMKRMRDVTLATFNDMLEKSEDPVRLIDQYLTAQSDQIIESEKVYSQLSQHVGQLRQQYLQAEQLKTKREDQAKLALKAGEDHLARIALQEKVLQEERSGQYLALYEQGAESLKELEEQLRSLKADYQSVYDKRHFYVARLESIRLQQKLNERLGGAGGSARIFDRLEEKLTDLELETKSLRELRKSGQELAAHAGSAMQAALDKEMLKLKAKLEQEGWMKS